MLIELISTSNYVNFNIKVAEIIGLHPAIYLSEIMNVNDKAIRKDKVTDSSFLLDRDYIKRRTTIGVDEQLEIEKNLIKIGIIEKPTDDENCIILNINVLTTLMMSTDEDLVSGVKKLSKLKSEKKKRGTKSEAIKDNLLTNIVTTNIELLEAYKEWIDAVVAKEGWMSKKAVLYGQSVIDEFSNRDLDVALGVLAIAAMHGYRDIQWAVNKYKEQYRVKREFVQQHNYSPVATKPVAISSEVF